MTEGGGKGLGRLGSWLRQQPKLPLAVGIGWVVYLPSQANIGRLLGDSIDQLIALQSATSHARAIEVIGSWTAADHAHFAAHLPFDLVHPLIYSVVLALSLAWGFRAAGVPSRFDPLLWLPFVAGAMDELENFCHHAAVQAAPDVPYWAFLAGAIGSWTKWTIAFAGVAALPVLIAVAWRRRRRDTP